MAGFGPCLIPDRFHLANQATLARGVRLSLAATGQALAWRRLWVSWAQTLSKRPDLSRARTVRTPWPPARPHRWPLRLSRVLTIIVFAASTAPLPMGEPASRAAWSRIRWRWLRTDPMAVVISPAPGLFRLRYRNASITWPTQWGSSVRIALCVSNHTALLALSAPSAASAAALRDLAGLPDIDEPDIRGQTLQTSPVVPGPIGDGDNLQLSVLPGRLRHPMPHLLADRAFQTGLAGFGKPGKSPCVSIVPALPCWATTPQAASRQPCSSACPSRSSAGIRSIVPSSETRRATASSCRLSSPRTSSSRSSA